jgi:hypothetical protein
MLGGASAQEVPAAPLPFAAYLDLHSGWSTGDEAGTFDGGSEAYTENWQEALAQVSARAALGLTPLVSVQFDGWTGGWSGHEYDADTTPYSEDYDYYGGFLGAAGHLTFNMTPTHRWGFLGSIGYSDEYGTYANIGIEGVHDLDNWRIYGQAGFTRAISGEAELSSSHYVYATALATYYFNPDFAFSGGVGFSRESANGYTDDDWRWTARLEKKFADLPFTAYLQYQGLHWNGSNDEPDSWSGTSHAFMVGFRFTVGRPTLRDLDQAVGLVDMNPEFGDVLH